MIAKLPGYQYAIVIATLFTASIAQADGLLLDHGRYIGPVLVFELSTEQKRIIDHYRICQLDKSMAPHEMNKYTPYVLPLTADQKRVLQNRKGFAPRYFEVFETYRGDNDAGPFWNLALRFSEGKIEVPLDPLITERASQAWQRRQGWNANNPCFPNLRN
ncbi:hypothetical protein bAD24_p00070 (plasmid) [Burkholderia sp. AD24]|nr:hypothetical protein bAD24_p00070 [Burkholderia sp. AD24]